jgi:hypothetical protein
MTIVEDALSGVMIVLPEGDPLARARVLAPRPSETPPRKAPRRGLISRLFPRKSSVEA